MIMDFLTSKWNLFVLLCLSYMMLGYMMYSSDIVFFKQVIMFMVISLIHFIAHLMGVSRGIMFATLHTKHLNAFLSQLDKMEKTNEPFDFDVYTNDNPHKELRPSEGFMIFIPKDKQWKSKLPKQELPEEYQTHQII